MSDPDRRVWTLHGSDGEPGAARPTISVDGPRLAHGDQVRVVAASRLEGVEAERDEANEALRECVRLSGDDVSDGFPTWPPLYEHAVQEVRRLREESDECPTPEVLEAAEARAERAEEALKLARSGVMAVWRPR